MTRVLFVAVLFAAAGAIFFATRGDEARAAGPCGTTHDGLDAEEQQFLSNVQAWRDSHAQVSSPLQASGALSAAAAWYAQDLIATGPKSNHLDSTGRSWGQRALDCGFPNPYATGGSGEGYSLSGGNISASAAIPLVTYAGSGLHAWTQSSSLPFKCVGVAVRRNAAGTQTAWVVVIAQYPVGSACPGGSPGGATTTSTATNTPTPTATKTPTPTPSPTPTPRSDGASIVLYEGWNLVTLPSGPIAQVLHRAEGCYSAVYQQQGDRWLRYAPGIPAYANNLQTLNGGAFWIEGTAEDCGLIQL